MSHFEWCPMPYEITSVDEPDQSRAVEIVNLYRSALLGKDPTNDPDALNRCLEDSFDGPGTYIAREGTALQGFATYDYRRGWLENLAVKPTHRNMGVGRFIISNVIELARSDGHEELRLRALPRVIPMYVRLGFAEVVSDPNRKIMPLMALDISHGRGLAT